MDLPLILNIFILLTLMILITPITLPARWLFQWAQL